MVLAIFIKTLLIGILRYVSNLYIVSGESCTMTFVTDKGNKFPNTVGVKIDDNTFVFGQNTEGHLKMVAVDQTGALLAARHGPHVAPENIGRNAVTKERWEGGNKTREGGYKTEVVKMACIGIEISNP